jgi:hypothetical protein
MSHAELIIGCAQMQDLEIFYGPEGGESEVQTLAVADVLRAGLVATFEALPVDVAKRLADELVQDAMSQLRSLVKGTAAFESLRLALCQDAAWLDVEACKGGMPVSLTDVSDYINTTLDVVENGGKSLEAGFLALLDKARQAAAARG